MAPRAGYQKVIPRTVGHRFSARGPGGDRLGWGHLIKEYTKPRQTIQSPDRLYKATTRLYKAPKRLYKVPEYQTKNTTYLTIVATNIDLTYNMKYLISKNNMYIYIYILV